MKNYNKNKESSYLHILPVNGLKMCKWVEDPFEFNKDFTKSYN